MKTSRKIIVSYRYSDYSCWLSIVSEKETKKAINQMIEIMLRVKFIEDINIRV